MSTIEQLRQKLIESGKITKEALTQKIEEKLKNLGGLISEEGALHIIANELSIPLQSSAPSPNTLIKDLTPGMRNVSVVVKVVKKYELRTFGQDGQGKVASLYVGDESGFARVTFWNDKTSYFQGINEDDVIELQQVYTKENNNRLEIHMGNASHCIVNPEGKTVALKERSEAPASAPEKKLSEITEEDQFVMLTATIVQVYDPRFFAKDATSGKKLTDEEAANATNVEYNYVMNIFLDDGTTNLRAALWKEQVQELLGKTDEELLALRADTESLEQIKIDLLGTIITARARVKKNEAYNNIELTLYDINTNPKPPVDKKDVPAVNTPEPKEDSETIEEPASTESVTESTTEEPVSSIVTEETTPKQQLEEESVELDEEELLSIDDIDEEL